MKTIQSSNPITGYPGIIGEINRIWETVDFLGRKKSYRKGEIITFKDSATRNFSYLKEGLIQSRCVLPNNIPKTSLFIFPGTLFHESISVIEETEDENIFVCRTDCKCIEFNGKILRDINFVEEHPELFVNLSMSFGKKLIKHATILNVKSLQDSFFTVCWYIFCMVKEHKKLCFTPGISQTDIADLLGISSTTMQRIIKQLKREGILDTFTKTRFAIKNIAKLEEIVFNAGLSR